MISRLANAPINNKPAEERGGGGRKGGAYGRDLINRFGPGVGHLNYLAVLGVGIFEFFVVPVTTNHFPGWGISVIFDLTFLPGVREFDSIFLENVKSPPYAPPSPPPPFPAGLTLTGA